MCSRINTLSAKIFRASRSCWTPSPCKKEKKTNISTCVQNRLLVHDVGWLTPNYAVWMLKKKKRSSKKWDKLQGLSWNAGEIHIYRKSPQFYPTLAEPLAQSQTFHFGSCSCSGPNAGCRSVSNHYTRQLMLITTWPTNCTTWKTGFALLWHLLWTSGSYLGFPFIGTPGNCLASTILLLPYKLEQWRVCPSWRASCCSSSCS